MRQFYYSGKLPLRWLFVCLFLLPLCSVFGQSTITVKGKAVDDNSQPMPGVAVFEKGTTNGTSTNANGEYTLTVSGQKAVLVFSFIGYTSEEVIAGNRTQINVTMVPDIKSLNEVVVVGYGTQRRAEITGSVASVRAADIAMTPNANLAQGLQSRVAGIQITQNSAAPGGNVSVRIRGVNSINGSSEPLYIIDGIQIGNGSGNSANSPSPLSQINPSDIESMEVLKDASSTSIYGARGANGVVIITTKRGKAGATRVTYDGYYGVQNRTKTLGVLNARQFAQLENETFPNRQLYPDPNSLGEGTDWQSLVLQQAPIQNHDLSLTAGSEKTQLLLSGNYFNQQGVVRTTGYERYSLRMNLDHTISQRFKVGVNLMNSVNVNKGVNTAVTDVDIASTTSGILGSAVAAPPTLQPYRLDGSLFPFEDQLGGDYRETSNPLGLLEQTLRQTARRTLGNLYLNAQIVKGLSYRATFNIDYTNSLGDFYSPRSILSQNQLRNGGGSASKSNDYNQTLLHESILTYETRFADRHSLRFTGVFASQRTVFESNSASGSQFPNDIVTNNNLSFGAIRNGTSFKNDQRLDSYMARVNYGFRNKIFVDLTMRADGSTKFGTNYKYGYFPAVGAAWRLIEEPFLKSQNVVSDLKLRGSWGVTGNADGTGPYASLALVGSGFNSTFNYQFADAPQLGLAPTGVPNPDLRWERSTQTNLGLDVSFLNNRVSLIADVYEKRTDDLIFSKLLPVSSGYSVINGNYASLRNRGVEVAVNARVVDKAVKWDVSGNLTFNRNKVLSLDEGATREIARGFVSYLVVGQPIGVYKTYIWDGIYQTGESFIPGDVTPRLGGARNRDVNGDGRIDSQDIVLTGNPNPDYIFGFTSNLAYKGFDLTVFVQGVQGNQLWNNLRYNLENPLGRRNLLAGTANRWSPTNPSNEYVSAQQGGRLPFSNRFVEDGSYVRLKTLTLGYRLPTIKGLQSVRLYVSANNLFTITNYTGFDPEVNTFGGNQSNDRIGVDNGVYPTAHTFLGGLQVTL
jgi:TonB-linked SusC/RagA family outer membrane protein